MLVDSKGSLVHGVYSTDRGHGGLRGHQETKSHGEEDGENQVDAGMKHGGLRSTKTRRWDVVRVVAWC